MDHNDVEIIDEGNHFDPDDDYNQRVLNRQDNHHGDHEDEMDPDGYGEEINNQNSSRFQLDNQDDEEEGLEELHDQLKVLDKGDHRHIIDDQNLESDHQDEEDEGQHYPDEEEDDDMIQLEEMEAQMQ